MIKIETVFSGSGVKAFASRGALLWLSENKIKIERVAITSAEAIFAAFVAAEYLTNELKQFF